MTLSSTLFVCFFELVVVTAEGFSLPQLSSPLGPVVNLGYAAFIGNSTSPTGEVNGPVTFFGGIPYAKPPIGKLRFRAPVPLDESAVYPGNVTITDARDWGPPCIQSPAEVGIGSEDCLTLNVWKPTDAKEGDKLPVVVYIHGGGFFQGTPQGFPLYAWSNQSRIVGVSMAYRLNLLGFLAGEAVRQDGDLNTGLLDQRAALEWVQRHIASFGGDPDQVTIDGQSAGGESVMMHMVAFGGSKSAPFKRGIGQSIGHSSIPTEEEAEAAFKIVAEVIGCPVSGSESMPCLRNASVGAIVAAINAVPTGTFIPIVDGPGGILPDLPTSLITSGNFTPIDVLTGHCTDEGRTLLPPPDAFVTDSDVARLVFGSFGGWPHVTNETIKQALALYPAPDTPGSPYESQYDRAGTMARDMLTGCLHGLAPCKQISGERIENVFTYRFNSPNPVLLAQAPFQGVMHTSELFYLFDGTTSAPNAGFTFTPFNSTEEALFEESIAFWTSFISTGNPSASRKSISPEWQPFSSGSRMVLNQPSSTAATTSASMMEVTPPNEIERCKF